MRERALSIQQQLMCCFIRTYSQTHGFPPSLREVSEWVGFPGMRSLQLALSVLEEQGYLKRNKHTSRSMVLTAQGEAVAQRWRLNVLEVA